MGSPGLDLPEVFVRNVPKIAGPDPTRSPLGPRSRGPLAEVAVLRWSSQAAGRGGEEPGAVRHVGAGWRRRRSGWAGAGCAAGREADAGCAPRSGLPSGPPPGPTSARARSCSHPRVPDTTAPWPPSWLARGTGSTCPTCGCRSNGGGGKPARAGCWRTSPSWCRPCRARSASARAARAGPGPWWRSRAASTGCPAPTGPSSTCSTARSGYKVVQAGVQQCPHCGVQFGPWRG